MLADTLLDSTFVWVGVVLWSRSMPAVAVTTIHPTHVVSLKPGVDATGMSPVLAVLTPHVPFSHIQDIMIC